MYVLVHTSLEYFYMQIEWTRTKIFKNGNSMAVRIPVQFNLEGDECYVRMQSNGDIQLRILRANKLAAFDALAGVEGFPEREQPQQQDRNGLL